MTDYKPMTTLREVKAWAKANGLVLRGGRGIYGNLFNGIFFKGEQIIPICARTVCFRAANALRQWHEEHRT